MTALPAPDTAANRTSVSPVAAPALGCVTAPGAGTFTSPAWEAATWFTVPGKVLSKSNFRNSKGNSWRAVSEYEQVVSATARSARPRGWPDFTADAPVIAVLAARTGIDAGNISKSVLDACQNVLYRNDACVRCLTDLAVPARSDLGLFAAFAVLPPDAGPLDWLTAQAELLAACHPVLAGTSTSTS